MKYKRKGSGAQDHSGCRRGAYERHFIVWQQLLICNGTGNRLSGS